MTTVSENLKSNSLRGPGVACLELEFAIHRTHVSQSKFSTKETEKESMLFGLWGRFYQAGGN